MTTKKHGISAHLKSLSPKELIKEIATLRKLFPQVREYYQAKLSETGETELLEKAKKTVRNEFFPVRGYGRARLAQANKAIHDFLKLSKNPVLLADLLLHYVENGVAFTAAYGDIDEPFYTGMENMYEKAARHIAAHNLQDQFMTRLKKVVTNTKDMGWGFNDSLEYIFTNCFPDIPLS